VEPSAEALNGSNSSANTGSSNTGSVTGNQIAAKAKQYLGVPYKWGGTSPSGFDCSGFVYYVYRSMGINISRTITTMYKQGTPVSKSDLQPGDIVIFQNTYKSGLSHVGIYVGDGKFIHAPSSGKVVSYADLYSNYYIEHYYGAVRYTK
jgi:cell wall-associated NlpC family hydrolase